MKILITGPLGQDGKILTKILENKHELIGVCRLNVPHQKVIDHNKHFKIELCMSDLTDIGYVEQLIKSVKPEIIINFAGETNVIDPWSNVYETFNQNFKIVFNFLESIKKVNRDIFFFQSSSSLMFGKSKERIINEKSYFSPLYPYGVSKLTSHNLLDEYRLKYNIKCCSGIFFNHDSFYRDEKFITKKISTHICDILMGAKKKLNLYNLNFYRDLSHAEDFMKAVEIIIEKKLNENFVFSSGNEVNFLDLSKKFFYNHNLDFMEFVEYTEDKKDTEFQYNIIGDSTKLKSFGWSPKYNTDDLINDMVIKEIKYRNR
jgi:GDPmannose 4,6-dehydratase